MKKGTKKIKIDPQENKKIVLSANPKNTLAETYKNLYLKAMYDLDTAGVINFLDRELIEWAVGEDKPFASYTVLAMTFGFYPAEISHIRSGVRFMKSPRIRIMLNKLEEIKRNEP